ncbi:hypothetical protein PYCC9005_000749 [Savitreella phatthalungensis]
MKAIAAFITRADELEGIEPLVSYWLRLYAVQKALTLSERPPALEARLGELMTLLERAKEDHPKVRDKSASKDHFNSFALRVFDNADKEARSGMATGATAQKFLAAATFLEACSIFDSNEEKDLVDRRKYARVQALRIQGALISGKDPNGTTRQPSEKDLEDELSRDQAQHTQQVASTPDKATSLAKTIAFAPVVGNSSHELVEITTATTDESESLPGLSENPDASRSPTVDLEQIALQLPPSYANADGELATRHARFAISALNYDDFATAEVELKKALAAIRSA